MEEPLELTLDEQGRSSRVVTLLELPEEGLQVLAYDMVQHAAVRRPTQVRAGWFGAEG